MQVLSDVSDWRFGRSSLEVERNRLEIENLRCEIAVLRNQLGWNTHEHTASISSEGVNADNGDAKHQVDDRPSKLWLSTPRWLAVFVLWVGQVLCTALAIALSFALIATLGVSPGGRKRDSYGALASEASARDRV
jgi:hypothetical protein